MTKEEMVDAMLARGIEVRNRVNAWQKGLEQGQEEEVDVVEITMSQLGLKPWERSVLSAWERCIELGLVSGTFEAGLQMILQDVFDGRAGYLLVQPTSECDVLIVTGPGGEKGFPNGSVYPDYFGGDTSIWEDEDPHFFIVRP
jgi:hypothetical protein